MRILVTGSRLWPDRDLVHRALREHVVLPYWTEEIRNWAGDVVTHLPPDDFVLVHGGCPTGVDHIVGEWCWHHGITPEVHRANWQQFRRGAGPIRNQEMVDLGADLCLAFILNGSRGASDCAGRAEKAGIPTLRFSPVDVVS